MVCVVSRLLMKWEDVLEPVAAIFGAGSKVWDFRRHEEILMVDRFVWIGLECWEKGCDMTTEDMYTHVQYTIGIPYVTVHLCQGWRGSLKRCLIAGWAVIHVHNLPRVIVPEASNGSIKFFKLIPPARKECRRGVEFSLSSFTITLSGVTDYTFRTPWLNACMWVPWTAECLCGNTWHGHAL